MRRVLDSIANIFKIPDLRRKVFFSVGMVILYRLGGYIPLPGINVQALWGTAQTAGADNLLGLYDMFVGGALSRATIFATGIMPYITASIILQLLGAVIPYFQKLQKEGEEGRRKLTQYTRYGTLFIAGAQSLGMVSYLQSLSNQGGAFIATPFAGWRFMLMGVLSLTTGAAVIMWIGELMTEKGIGNGMSILILVGIVSRLPIYIKQEVVLLTAGGREPTSAVVIIVGTLLFIAAAILLSQGTRQIPVQYARKVVGRKVYGGSSTHLPLRINAAGVIPIIFASSVMFIPTVIIGFLPEGGFKNILNSAFAGGSLPYNIVFGVIIIFFAYFYTAVQFNPTDVADNMKKYGGFIPGRRPGKQTSEYIDRILTRITLPGAVGLALIAIIPVFFMTKVAVGNPGIAHALGGTTLLILVGVIIDTLQQIESHLLMRHYDGFMKKGKIRGRR
ncbi:MAG TPA: preprotein translocase subunit SecY [candidate division Zixibacteria bacterium]|nr:preprotein translocase subunit SecY [candidate division Zixibacteria bacterium]